MRRILDQGMLEDVRRLRWQPLLVRELGLGQLVRLPRKVASSQGAMACNNSYENSRPSVAPSCASPLIVARRSSRAIRESWSVAGIAGGGRGSVSA